MTVEQDIAAERAVTQERPTLLRSMVRTVRRERLFDKNRHLLVAVSGGPDSVALLSLLCALASTWRLSLTAVHFNYGLRADESEADAAFVESFCRRLDVPLLIRRLDIGGGANSVHAGSLQEEARDRRYGLMRKLAVELRADKVVLGHTADDQAETALMWMVRGAGMAGLSGMPYEREHLFVRPLLDVARVDILAYLQSKGLSFRTDSSNSRSVYFRNRIRHELLPVVKRLAPAVLRVVQRQADILREEDGFLEQLVSDLWTHTVVEESRGIVCIDRSHVMELPLALQRRLVRKILRLVHPQGKAPRLATVTTVLNQLMHAHAGARATVGPIRIERDYDRIRFSVGSAPMIPGGAIPLTVPSRVSWPGTELRIEVRWVDRSEGIELLEHPSRDRMLIDADRITVELHVRSWAAGDRFCPAGLQGRRKKVQDYYSDIKLPRSERHRLPLLVAPEGILWIVGYRQDERFHARPHTRRFLCATMSRIDSSEGAR